MKPYRLLTVLLLLVPLVFTSVAASPRQGTTPPWATGAQPSSVSPQLRTPDGGTMSAGMLTKLFPKLSAGAQGVLAPKLGITSLAGKKLNISKMTDMDNIVSVDDYINENNPSLAVNPANEAIVVSVHQYYPTSTNRCLAEVSFDGGDTFDYNNYVLLPLQAGGNMCANPVVRFSPDGTYAYYFYMDIDSSGLTSDIVMVRANGYDPTSLLTGPIVVLDDLGSFLDKPWGDVAYFDVSGSSDGAVYVTGTYFTSGGICGILFNASTDYGNTWTYGTSGTVLDSTLNCYRSTSPVLQGSRPIGNPVSGWVTVCWYNSESDGWLSGAFDIRCWSNSNWGSGGSSYFFTAVNDQKYELPFYLGPSGAYHRWWNSMFPALAVDNTGLVYIAYTADPTSNPSDVESGNVFLARGWPDGISWKTQPLGTGSFAQGFPTVAARCSLIPSAKCYAYVAYGDYMSSNAYYKIVYRQASRTYSYTLPTALTLGPKKTISDVPSFSDAGDYFIGDYIDSFVTNRRYEVIWPDRSDVTSVINSDDDVMHDVLLP